MAYTVTQLITNAYYSSSLVAREFETIQGYQLNDALQWLNELLLDNTVDAGEIPYITTWLQFNSTTGQEKYFVANLIDIQSIVFFIQSVRYEMKFVGRKKYFSTPRANNINALPLSYTYERTYGGVNLFLYFFPDQPYTMQIVGNMYMTPVTLNQDLTVCTANLGTYTLTGTTPYVLTQGNLVVNGVDLEGSYADINALIAYINTGVVPNVIAGLAGTQFVLTSQWGGSQIQVQTIGTESTTNHITFQYFSTLNGLYQVQYTALDQFYIDFLRYRLARRICMENNFAVPPTVREMLEIYQKKIVKMAEPMDLQLQKTSVLTRAIGVNWAQANVGKGWTTNGGY